MTDEHEATPEELAAFEETAAARGRQMSGVAEPSPKKSPEKLYDFLEQLSQLEDDQLREMLPVSPGMARMGIAAAAERVPEDAEKLDATLAKVAMFVAELQSDDARYFDVVPHVDEELDVADPAAFAEPANPPFEPDVDPGPAEEL